VSQNDDEPTSSAAADPARDPAPRRRPYEKPCIVWREPYEPIAFGISCAKQPGNPGCGPGPFTA
jgi:hypothetical protein